MLSANMKRMSETLSPRKRQPPKRLIDEASTTTRVPRAPRKDREDKAADAESAQEVEDRQSDDHQLSGAKRSRSVGGRQHAPPNPPLLDLYWALLIR